MLLAEEPLELLLDRLRALSADDRQAVLARLAPAELRRLDEALHAAPKAPTCDFAPDMAERIAAPPGDGTMTAAGRESLARAVARRAPARPVDFTRRATPSLLDRLGQMRRR